MPLVGNVAPAKLFDAAILGQIGNSSVSPAADSSELVNSSTRMIAACGEREYNHVALVLGQLIRPLKRVKGVVTLLDQRR